MKKIENLREIISLFSADSSIVLHSALAEPAVLGAQLAENASQLKGVKVYCLMPMGATEYGAADSAAHLQINTFLPGAGLRAAVNDGRANVMPVRLYDIPMLFENNECQANFIFLQVSTPDDEGNYSLGLSVDHTLSVLKQKPIVIAEINPQMPRTSGDSLLRADQIHYAMDVDYPPQTMPSGKADAIDEAVAKNVVGLLRDGAVLQYGIGTIPELVLELTGHLNNLSIHTGLITDAIMPAMASGSYDNTGNPDHVGKVVAAMAGGSSEFYRFLDGNKDIVFRPTTYTHNYEVLKRIDNLFAINSVLQVDLGGRANAERIGNKIISCPGGLLDFAKGATASKGGASILALRSTTRNGGKSCIVDKLTEGTPVTVDSEHLDFIVTEYGVARVRGLVGKALANEIRSVAHPEFSQIGIV